MSKNDITGDKITTGGVSEEYRENYDTIFKKKGCGSSCGCGQSDFELEVEYTDYIYQTLREDLGDTTEKECKPF